MPRDLESIRGPYEQYASRLRTRDERLNGHYDQDVARRRIEGAVCDVVAPSIDRAEIVDSVFSATQRMANRCR